jgi:oligopeptide/dipeptide ABC transporter ATP-binding protein
MTALVEIEQLKVYFKAKSNLLGRGGKRIVKAIDGVSLRIGQHQVVGLVGESGSGKSTLGRAVMRLNPVHEGKILFQGRDITHLPQRELAALRPKMQMIFQDPNSSLNPRMTVREIIREPMLVNRIGSQASHPAVLKDLMEQVGLPEHFLDRHPHEMSGGQRQRVAIARALSTHPALIVADEPISALDVSVQAQILNLLLDLKAQQRLAMLFISHDLAVVRHVSDVIAVMYLGHIMEIAPAVKLFAAPTHPYTQLLIESIPTADPFRKKSYRIIKGELPSAMNPPPGCVFHTRCPAATAQCKLAAPALTRVSADHLAACHLIGSAPVRSPEINTQREEEVSCLVI